MDKLCVILVKKMNRIGELISEVMYECWRMGKSTAIVPKRNAYVMETVKNACSITVKNYPDVRGPQKTNSLISASSEKPLL